jgi:hypothetical protein
MTAPKPRRVDFYPTEWLEGTRELEGAEIALYIQVVATIYARGCPVDDDLDWLQRLCPLHGRVLRRARERLITLGKLRQVTYRGRACLTNDRAERELAATAARIHKSRNPPAHSTRTHAKLPRNLVETSSNHDENLEPVSWDFKDLAVPPTTNHQPPTLDTESFRDSPPNPPAGRKGEDRAATARPSRVRASDFGPVASKPKAAAVPPDYEPTPSDLAAVRKARPDLTDQQLDRRRAEFAAHVAHAGTTSLNPGAYWRGFMIKTGTAHASAPVDFAAKRQSDLEASIQRAIARSKQA